MTYNTPISSPRRKIILPSRYFFCRVVEGSCLEVLQNQSVKRRRGRERFLLCAHLWMVLWSRSPLKVMIRIQCEERNGAAGLVKGWTCKCMGVGGYDANYSVHQSGQTMKVLRSQVQPQRHQRFHWSAEPPCFQREAANKRSVALVIASQRFKGLCQILLSAPAQA